MLVTVIVRLWDPVVRLGEAKYGAFPTGRVPFVKSTSDLETGGSLSRL